MAPQKKKKKKTTTKSSSGPKLQISEENERRLRRLLLSSASPSTATAAATATTAPADHEASTSVSKAQKAKRLRAIYDKLSCEGFRADQIERALSALNEGATFEAALDWLCLNLQGDELPLKFSSGVSTASEARVVGVISTAREGWVPSADHSKPDTQVPMTSIPVRKREDSGTLELRERAQADWILQYVEQQEEDEWETLASDLNDNDAAEETIDPSSRASSIAKEYHKARLEAMNAKATRDKKRQERAGNIIRKLKLEMSALGLSDEILSSEFDDCDTKDASYCLPDCNNLETMAMADSGNGVDNIADRIEPTAEEDVIKLSNSSKCDAIHNSLTAPVQDSSTRDDEEADVELSDFFSEDVHTSGTIPSEVLKFQKKEKITLQSSGLGLEKIDGIWKKGDARKIPKAVLHQFCQKLGWEAPKFNKLPGIKDKFGYSVSILRKASGRGKSKKAGGLVTFQLPDKDETFKSAEDAQNSVAAFALCNLFPELPVSEVITEPYSSFITMLHEGETLGSEDSEETRRSSFVDSLLSADIPQSDSMAKSSDAKFSVPLVQENVESIHATTNTKNLNKFKEEESIHLQQEHRKKMKLFKYKEMLEARASLPVSKVKDQILHALKENDVTVVCGETGCGKTTQVPQYILDEMIEEGVGGYCNIICTQPRRIAAISVAERVGEERCEPPLGTAGSLVGFQVRLDSARSDKTKLMFCTTGILLRKLAGDKNLADVTHVIVDEVHERSLLGDFLLIVLHNLIEKQSVHGMRKLKVILMSATVDSGLFSRYFGNCPVITAEGRTHPVSTYFLENIYEHLSYSLASDSPASIRNIVPIHEKHHRSTLNNHRRKKNLVLSAWGDDSLLSESYVNPNFEPTVYHSYSERTRENLKSLNEEIIDYDLLEDLVCDVDDRYPPGAILVFLPGVSEIHLLLDRLAASYRFGGESSNWLLPLHSSLASAEQRKVFLSPPENIRKVIIATDIAETSITIDDVIYVIDCGKHKENRYNPQKKLSSMVEDWISQANARQRKGRAGRVKPGFCFCLYTQHRYTNLMRPYQVPEMLRMPLVELCLQIKSLSLGYIRPFLMRAIEPPREEAIASALSVLYEVGAVEGNEELTPLGYHLAKLPVDVLIGKMLIYGGIFRCMSPILSVSACLSYKSPFLQLKDEKQSVERAKQSLLGEKLDSVDTGHKQSDHLLMVVAYSKWARVLHEKGVKAAQSFCSSYYISSSVMYMIRDMRIQLGTLLADIGLINLPKTFQSAKMKDKLDNWFADTNQPFNAYSHHPSVFKSILCAGLYPNVAATGYGITDTASASMTKAYVNPSGNGRICWFDGRREVYIHPSSSNSNLKAYQYPFLVYLEKVETNKVFLRDTSIISPYSILLFGGTIDVQHQSGQVIIDGWLKLTAPAQTAVLFKELRLRLHHILGELIKKPEMAMVAEDEVIRSIIHLLLEEDKMQK
ncbi:hypothetical protein Syun_003026 [Stephania yunnanensis]|uniref:RNA helicase n=1 Tax=Stephania yunnanensis TaxID=152371 RepID=A0AAP0L2F7_9MAGN